MISKSKMLFSSIFMLICSLIQQNQAQSSTPPGALISTEFESEVGFLLDEIPTDLNTRDSVISYIYNQVTEQQWIQRAELQIKFMTYRQVFRPYYKLNRLQLTLPPEQVWKISFTEPPKALTYQGHSYISRDYTFTSVLVGSDSSVEAAEPKLVKIGGKYKDSWYLPIDPETFFARTGYACENESNFPKDSVNSENAWSYYDFDCAVEPFIDDASRTYQLNNDRCHWTEFPDKSCMKALKDFVGYRSVDVTWTRIAWSENEAFKWRYGEQTSNYADLKIYGGNILDEKNIVYKYFDQTSCTLLESAGSKTCVDKAGWRQLLRFTSTAINVGKTDLAFGDVDNPLYLSNNIFEFDNCHLHYHFQHYAQFSFGPKPGRKVGFCLQSTWRYHNNEWTGLGNDYYTCQHQGIGIGWGDDYYQGIDCQWVDITGMTPGVYNLTDHVNNDGFLCEGQLQKDSNGNLIFVATGFTTSTNQPVNRQGCNYVPDYEKNNIFYTPIRYSGASDTIVTQQCRRKAQLTPKKDCGFKLQFDMLVCTPDQVTTINVSKRVSRDAIIRICESSVELGHSTYCEYAYALANELLVGNADSIFAISFKCPAMRSSSEPGGRYSILVSTLIPDTTVPILKLEK